MSDKTYWRERARLRMQQYREGLTPEEKEREREKARLRMRRLRANRKEEQPAKDAPIADFDWSS